MLSSQNIFAVIPAYNEGRHIKKVVEETQNYLPVLVVDDGSKDDTAQAAGEAGATVFSLQPNQGKGVALRQGFQEALARGCEAVVMLDADGQHAPGEIPRFLDCYAQHHSDLIIGERDYRQMPPLRRTTNTFGRWSFSLALGHYVPDNQSGYRLLSRRMLELTLQGREARFEYEVEMIVQCVKAGYRMDWVPISTIYADEVSHIQPVRHVIKWFQLLWTTFWKVRTGS
jgi:glycosyltransferase involved in cell wall biosynthesis